MNDLQEQLTAAESKNRLNNWVAVSVAGLLGLHLHPDILTKLLS